MSHPFLLEVVVDSVESALAAQEGGAQRVELCADLLEGGITPSAGMIAAVRRAVSIGVMVMIRPRGGDFCYSPAEFAVMQHDVRVAKDLGADGVVFGILTPAGDIDVERMAALIALARPLRVTCHRAFDMTRDPRRALADLIGLGVERVLTSGGESSALEGLDLLVELTQQAQGRIVVMPGGGITERNIGKIVAVTGAREVHVSAATTMEGPMSYRNTRTFMGGALRPPEFTRTVTDAARVRAMLAV
ncbi:MAG: thiamine phosphate synthase [Anaerolineae bacterium]|nr:thiamine phosphate synthase [Anaerolineae bacterium]